MTNLPISAAGTKRKIILHYHIFKNAGTSIDRMLRQSFGNRWMNIDRPNPGERISASEMEQLILDRPDTIAFSSHQVVPPLPSHHLDVFPIVFLRHPIDRAYSAYLFEWQKQKQAEQPIGKFEDYVLEKFKLRRRNAIEDFQVFHLANNGYDRKRPAPNLSDEDILQNSREFLKAVGYFGVVDQYRKSLEHLKSNLASHFPDLVFHEYKENAMRDGNANMGKKIERIRSEMSDSTYTELIMRNQLDLRLYEYALGLFSSSEAANRCE